MGPGLGAEPRVVPEEQAPATIGEMVTGLASQAAKAGITIDLTSSNFSFIVTCFDNPVPASGNPAGVKAEASFLTARYASISRNADPRRSRAARQLREVACGASIL